MKSSTYYVHVKTKILADFQICISVPLIIFTKHCILNFWKGSEYVLSFKFVTAQSIPGVSNWHGCEFPDFTEFTYFCKYDKVLNMRLDVVMEGFWVFKDYQHGRLEHMLGLRKFLNMPEYGLIMLE